MPNKTHSSATPATEQTSIAPGKAPYPPGWFDVLKLRVEALPGPWWLPYAIFGGVMLTAQYLVNWASGVVLPELSQIYFVLIAGGSAFVLGMTHFLDRAAMRAVREFRPALKFDEASFQKLVYTFTTMPRGWTLAFSLTGMLFVVIGLVRGFTPFQLLNLDTPTYWQWFHAGVELLLWFVNGMFIFHTIRQLYLVKEVYDKDAQINLFQLGPLYALSGLTARTALAIVVLGYGAAFTGSQVTAAETRLGTFILASFGIFLCFLVPLLGIHRRLVQEKTDALSEINARLEATITKVHVEMDAGELEKIAPLKDLSETLEMQQRVVEKIPTWPWQPETLNVVITALVLPIVLFIIQFIIQKLLEP